MTWQTLSHHELRRGASSLGHQAKGDNLDRNIEKVDGYGQEVTSVAVTMRTVWSLRHLNVSTYAE
jgi:hypothetical protein